MPLSTLEVARSMEAARRRRGIRTTGGLRPTGGVPPPAPPVARRTPVPTRSTAGPPSAPPASPSPSVPPVRQFPPPLNYREFLGSPRGQELLDRVRARVSAASRRHPHMPSPYEGYTGELQPPVTNPEWAIPPIMPDGYGGWVVNTEGLTVAEIRRRLAPLYNPIYTSGAGYKPGYFSPWENFGASESVAPTWLGTRGAGYI